MAKSTCEACRNKPGAVVANALHVCLDCLKLIKATSTSEYLIIGTNRNGDSATLGTLASRQSLPQARKEYRHARQYATNPGSEQLWKKIVLIKRATVIVEIPLESVEAIS